MSKNQKRTPRSGSLLILVLLLLLAVNGFGQRRLAGVMTADPKIYILEESPNFYLLELSIDLTPDPDWVIYSCKPIGNGIGYNHSELFLDKGSKCLAMVGQLEEDGEFEEYFDDFFADSVRHCGSPMRFVQQIQMRKQCFIVDFGMRLEFQVARSTGYGYRSRFIDYDIPFLKLVQNAQKK